MAKFVICNILPCFDSFLSVVMVTLAFALLVNFTEQHILAFESVEADFMTQFNTNNSKQKYLCRVGISS